MTVFRLYNGSVMKEELEKYHKKEHAKRYGTNAKYQKSSFNLGWRIQPLTSIKGRKSYKWGKETSTHPDNLANPFTKRVPSLIDFLQIKEPRYLFYALEDWEISDTDKLSVEADLISKAILYWRLMIFTNQFNDDQKNKVKHYLKIISKIALKKFEKNGFWPYPDGLMHVYNEGKLNLEYNIFNDTIFFNFYKEFANSLKIYFRESDSISDNKLKQDYWIKICKIINKKKLTYFKKIIKEIDINEKLFIVIIFLYLNHISYKAESSEPKNDKLSFKSFYEFTVKYINDIEKNITSINDISVTLMN